MEAPAAQQVVGRRPSLNGRSPPPDLASDGKGDVSLTMDVPPTEAEALLKDNESFPHPDRRCNLCHPHWLHVTVVSEHQSRRFLVSLMLALWLVLVSWVVYKEIEVVGFPEADEWMWCGGVTTTTANFRMLTRGTRGLSMVLSLTEDLESPVWGPEPIPSGNAHRVHEFRASGLSAGTHYFYGAVCEPKPDRDAPDRDESGVEACWADDDEIHEEWLGDFKTMPEGPANFTVAFASCADTGSHAEVFVSIARKDPDLFIHMGDLHYSNIVENDPELYQRAFSRVMGSPSQRRLFTTTKVAYMWDDHDFGGNDATSLSPSKPAAREVYQRCVPHYPLEAPVPPEGQREGAGGDGWRDTWQDTAIYQAFTMGRVRFILTDLRSESVPSGPIMGEEQKAWLKGELSRAHEYVAVVWVSTVPWIGASSEGSDSWHGHIGDREEIAAFIAANVTARNLVMIAGDAHMLAIDDGSNSDYAPGGGGGGFPVMQAAPMDRPGSTKGGPYSEGCRGYLWEKIAHYGMMSVRDLGGSLEDGACIDFQGYKGGIEHRGASPIIRFSTCTPTVRQGDPGAGICHLHKYPLKTLGLLWAGVACEAAVLVTVLVLSRRWPWTLWAAVPVVGFMALDIFMFGVPVLVNVLERDNEVQLLLPAELLAGLFITHAACVLGYVVLHPEVYQTIRRFLCCGAEGGCGPVPRSSLGIVAAVGATVGAAIHLGGVHAEHAGGVEMGEQPGGSMERLVDADGHPNVPPPPAPPNGHSPSDSPLGIATWSPAGDRMPGQSVQLSPIEGGGTAGLREP